MTAKEKFIDELRKHHICYDNPMQTDSLGNKYYETRDSNYTIYMETHDGYYSKTSYGTTKRWLFDSIPFLKDLNMFMMEYHPELMNEFIWWLRWGAPVKSAVVKLSYIVQLQGHGNIKWFTND